jgi:ubiquinone biosynthesis protein UbiJ
MKTGAKNFLAETLQKAVNAYVSLDPESLRRIQALDGKVVTIELLATGVVFHLFFTDGAIQIQPGKPVLADTIIKGTPLRLLHLAISREQRQQFFSDDVSIQGNLELGQLVIDLFDHLEIDWEELLSRFIGDIPAHHLGRLTGKFKAWTDMTRKIFSQDVSEYIHEEIDLFPPREALKDFFQDVDAVRMDTDRLEAKLKHLQKTLSAKRSAK